MMATTRNGASTIIDLSVIGVRELIALVSIVAALSGFYYTTKLRIDNLEENHVNSDETERRIIALEERTKSMDEKIEFIYQATAWNLRQQQEMPKAPRK
jgi:hypothetical protein